MKALPADLTALDETNRRFLAEIERYGFRYRCDACAHLHVSSNECSLGYPNHYLTGPQVAIQADGNLTFCKYFELGEQG